jgi:hypothetical protein
MEVTIKTFETLVVDLIVFFLVILLYYTSFTTEMQKREWCYAYIRYDYCFCQNNPVSLINRTLKINPFESRSTIPEDQMNESIWRNIQNIDEKNKKLGIR